MNLRVATVLSAREWESRLVAAARTSASVRLVLRAFLPDEVIEHSHELDVVVVGSETPWVSTARLAAWVRAGIRVVGIHPMGDRPAADRLASAGVDLVLSDDLPAETILREIRLLEPAAERSDPSHPLVAVTSGGGAPGRTEIALALAWTLAGRARCTLVDADLTAPGLAVRLGIPPRPDLADAVDAVHETGTVPDHLLHPAGRLRIVTGSHRSGEPPLRPEPVFDVIDAPADDTCSRRYGWLAQWSGDREGRYHRDRRRRCLPYRHRANRRAPRRVGGPSTATRAQSGGTGACRRGSGCDPAMDRARPRGSRWVPSRRDAHKPAGRSTRCGVAQGTARVLP